MLKKLSVEGKFHSHITTIFIEKEELNHSGRRRPGAVRAELWTQQGAESRALRLSGRTVDSGRWSLELPRPKQWRAEALGRVREGEALHDPPGYGLWAGGEATRHSTEGPKHHQCK